MTFQFEIYRASELDLKPLVTADLVYVNVGVASAKPDPLPDDLRSRVRAYERVAV